MTFNQLFIEFQKRYGNTHDIIFFELLFCLSKCVKDKNSFVSNRDKLIDFKNKKFEKLCKDYFEKEKPLSHITGHTKFCNLDFIVYKKVLSPRDVTEQMVNDFIARHNKLSYAKVIDLCCGSGCIGISIKKYIHQFDVVCIDKYWQPIFNTHDNAKKYKIALTIDCKDAIKYLNTLTKVDFIVSNPPYINKDNFSNNKMFRWENKKALIAPENGLYFYKKYFEWLNAHEFNEAWLEIGYDQKNALQTLADNYKNIKIEIPNERQYIIVKRKQ